MTMEIVKLEASSRPEGGKSPARRLRREGRIPAIAYGKDLAATPLAISPKGLHTVLQSAHGKNTVVELTLDGSSKLTLMLRDYSYHPISRQFMHADFVQVKLDQPVVVEVPFRCVGKAKGVTLGGVLQQVFRTLPVRCLPEQIPVLLEHDVTDVDLHGTVKARDLKLPEGVSVTFAEDQTLVVVAAPEKGGDEAAATPAAGAPAAGAAPAAARGGAPAAAAKGAAPAAAAKAAAPAKGKK